MNTGNLFANVPRSLAQEQVEQLLTGAHVTIERIVSCGQTSPPGFWYDQAQAEWVVLLTGAAGVQFEGEPAARDLKPGDYLYIPAHRHHRVEWTDAAQPTIWLAVHFS